MYTLCWVTRTMQINEEGYELQRVTNDWAHVWFLWGAGNDEAMLGFTHLGELVKPDYGLIKLYLGRNLMHVKRGYLGKKYGYSGKNITGWRNSKCKDPVWCVTKMLKRPVPL